MSKRKRSEPIGDTTTPVKFKKFSWKENDEVQLQNYYRYGIRACEAALI